MTKESISVSPSLGLAGLSLNMSKSKQIAPLPLSNRRRSAAPIERAPQTPALPSPSGSTSPIIPARRILSPLDLATFQASPTDELIRAWIFGLSDSVKGKAISLEPPSDLSDVLEKVLSMLELVTSMLQECPPLDTGSRFGNPIFRTFHRAVTDASRQKHTELFGLDDDIAAEVTTYFDQCFGSAERLDYGSGHELNFSLWLLCLNRLDILQSQDMSSIVLYIFPKYWNLMRQIQSAYYLEPAGSHGVWGLDDYQFLPFLFGASQLVSHPYITPRAIHNSVILDEEGDKYLYLNQVRWVDSVKTVKGIRWHSPMLDDISSAKSWQKVEDGMKKMFVKEILGKLPIMQHFLFGSLIPAATEMGQIDPEVLEQQAARMKHVNEQGHEPDYWGDCCGIKVPSTVAAGEEMRKRLGTSGALRPIPFD